MEQNKQLVVLAMWIVAKRFCVQGHQKDHLFIYQVKDIEFKTIFLSKIHTRLHLDVIVLILQKM